MGRRKRRLLAEPANAVIDSLSHDGRGIAHINGKAVFISGALPGEEIVFRYVNCRRQFDEGVVEQVIVPSPERVEPKCLHFNRCGGCSMQHLKTDQQLIFKQQLLLDNLKRIGHVAPQVILEPIQSNSPWHYRTKARLGVRYVAKKDRVFIGFREKGSSLITDTEECIVLNDLVGKRITVLQDLIQGLSIRQHIPQIEVAVGDDQVCLVFRILQALNGSDIKLLKNFSERFNFDIRVQSGGPETVKSIDGNNSLLHYSLSEWDLRLEFGPQDFTQVNRTINRLMIKQSLQLLALEPNDRVMDLFCGLGNFTLPLAKFAGQVIGVEADMAMVHRARANATMNQLENVEFYAADLFQKPINEAWLNRQYDKILLDPPRSGAKEVMTWLPQLKAKKILYVSCNPATLARDADTLVNQEGYTLRKTGVIDMFPHTSHVEAMALFERE